MISLWRTTIRIRRFGGVWRSETVRGAGYEVRGTRCGVLSTGYADCGLMGIEHYKISPTFEGGEIYQA